MREDQKPLPFHKGIVRALDNVTSWSNDDFFDANGMLRGYGVIITMTVILEDHELVAKAYEDACRRALIKPDPSVVESVYAQRAAL